MNLYFAKQPFLQLDKFVDLYFTRSNHFPRTKACRGAGRVGSTSCVSGKASLLLFAKYNCEHDSIASPLFLLGVLYIPTRIQITFL